LGPAIEQFGAAIDLSKEPIEKRKKFIQENSANLIERNRIGEEENEYAWRRRRWLKLIKNYDYKINYHTGKVNVVADALSKNSKIELAALGISQS
jgi:hypothetical protein